MSVRNNLAVLSSIHGITGQSLDGERRWVSANIGAHPRGLLGRADHELAHFGLCLAELRERFRFYADHVGLEGEPAADPSH